MVWFFMMCGREVNLCLGSMTPKRSFSSLKLFLSLGSAILGSLTCGLEGYAVDSPTGPNPIFPRPPVRRRIPKLPPLPDVLKQLPARPLPNPEQPEVDVSPSFVVQSFQIQGGTVLSSEELSAIVKPYLNRPITRADLLSLQNAITNRYLEQGYLTSGAVIPANQAFEQGVVSILLLEGALDNIEVLGTKRLRKRYVRDRIQLGAKVPLNINQLSEALRKLQLNPLIDGLSSKLSASDLPGFNRLTVTVDEANSGRVYLGLDNSRSASIGRLERSISAEEQNLTGRGDAVTLRFANTDGSNDISGSYSVPVNARDGTLNLGFQQSWSQVISDEVQQQFEIDGSSLNLYLGFRQPIVSKSTEEVALGIRASRTQNQTLFNGLPLPLSGGADDQGRTRITGLQFYQEWLKREERQLFSVRSEFGAGLDIAATRVADLPDGRFVKWRGQGQWIRRLFGESQLFVNSNLQLAATGLPQIEQLGLGGPYLGRGYPSNFLLVDNGVSTSAEVRVPVLSVENRKGVLQVVPFMDYGMGWNLGSERNIDGSNHMLSAGVGMQWQWSDRIFAQVSWGMPLISSARRGHGFDKSQVFFSINANVF